LEIFGDLAMNRPAADHKRTVPLAKIDEPPHWEDGEPGGAFLRHFQDGTTCLFFRCPGCGKMGHIRIDNPKPADSPSWDVVSPPVQKTAHGLADFDLSQLTLSPSIRCIGCCGWHGYLRNGVFESC
jgi:cytochrome c1